MITLRQLEAFGAVARTGSLVQAARELGASPPTVSLQVKALGRLLGSPLLRRHGRGVRLTPAGEAVYLYARQVTEGLRGLRQHLQSLEDGRAGAFVVGASATTGGYVLPAILSRFHARFPKVDIQLHVDTPEHLFRDLLAHALDLVFSVGVRTPPGVSVEPFGDEEMVVVISAQSPLARRRRVTARELSEYPLVTSLPGALYRELVEDKLRQAGVTPRVTAEARHPEAMKKLVENGMGYALLFRPSVADELASGRLVGLQVEGRPIMGQLIMASRPSGLSWPLLQHFVSFVRAELAVHRSDVRRGGPRRRAGLPRRTRAARPSRTAPAGRRC